MPDAIKTLVQKDKELLGGSGIKLMWQGMNPPANDQIHVLVKLPEKFVPNKRPRWTTGVEPYEPKINKLAAVPRIDIDNNEKYVKLPAALLRACGLFSSRDMMLYRRSGVNDLWTYLINDVVRDNKRPFVVGPAGVGKSTCALSFAASLDPAEWSVVWIHVGVVSSCLIMRTKEWWEFVDIANFVLPRIADEKLFVFVDGYTDTEAHGELFSNVLARLIEDKDRLVVCSRIAALGKRNDDDDGLLNIESYSMYSWMEEEYHEAIAEDAFYATVADKLDASSIDYQVNAEDASGKEEKNEQEKKKQVVKSKLYRQSPRLSWRREPTFYS